MDNLIETHPSDSGVQRYVESKVIKILEQDFSTVFYER